MHFLRIYPNLSSSNVLGSNFIILLKELNKIFEHLYSHRYAEYIFNFLKVMRWHSQTQRASSTKGWKDTGGSFLQLIILTLENIKQEYGCDPVEWYLDQLSKTMNNFGRRYWYFLRSIRRLVASYQRAPLPFVDGQCWKTGLSATFLGIENPVLYLHWKFTIFLKVYSCWKYVLKNKKWHHQTMINRCGFSLQLKRGQTSLYRLYLRTPWHLFPSYSFAYIWLRISHISPWACCPAAR